MEVAAAASSHPLDCAAGDCSVTNRLLVDSGSQTEAWAKPRGGGMGWRRKRCSVSLASLAVSVALVLAALLILLLDEHTWLHSHSDELVPQSDEDCMAASVGMDTGTWTYEDGPEMRSWTVRPPAASQYASRCPVLTLALRRVRAGGRQGWWAQAQDHLPH